MSIYCEPSLERMEPRVFLDAGLLGEYFNETNLAGASATRVDPVVAFPDDILGDDGGGMAIADDAFSIRWTGFVKTDQSGLWQFTTFSNDGVRLWIDGTKLIDNWGQHFLTEDNGLISLDAGWHSVTLEYFQDGGSSHIELLYSGPGFVEAVIPSTHLSTTDMSGDPIADAGPDKYLVLPDAGTTLNGTGTDVDGVIVDYEWTQQAGPAATMTGADTDALSLSGLVEGSYVFRLTVIDNDGKTAWDDANVTVAPEGSGNAVITGELKTWHKTTFTWAGPMTSESASPNPFLDYRLQVVFTGPSGQTYEVPGYYAADGDAANTRAADGDKWRCHFAPDEPGEWSYSVSFRSGNEIAVSDDPAGGVSGGFFDGDAGTFTIAPTDKTGRDFRGKGVLAYVGGHYLQFAGTGEYFLKQGADAPENFLAYQEFDGPFASDGQNDHLVKSWSAHVSDWNAGDPTWAADQGKGIIGAVNYLASEGMNAFSFLPMNINGDDRNVFPYLDYNERYRMDCSRLDQWEIVFEHGTRKGMFLHFKTQEAENQLLLDGGDLGVQRKLYYRELIARFSHNLALNWNLGEEIGSASTAQKKAWARYFWEHDPYQHHIVIHNGADHYDLLGPGSDLTGFSLQTNREDFANVHASVLNYLNRSDAAGKPWAVACDEPGDPAHAIRPAGDVGASWENGRKNALWGTLLAGGWGNEYYFGYNHAHSDLTCEDFRSRDGWWDYCRYALQFFDNNDIPFQQMTNDNALSTAADDYCFYKDREVYVVYLKSGGTTNLDLSAAGGAFDVLWYDPRNGGPLQTGSVISVSGGGSPNLGQPPHSTSSDWVILVRPGSGDPVADAGDDRSIMDLGDDGVEQVTLDGTGSYDPGGTIVSHVWTRNGSTIATGPSPTVDLALGEHTITLTVTDDENNIDTDTVVITVNPYVNHPPVADAGPDQALMDTDDNGVQAVTLNGAGSYDTGGTITSYVWSEGGNQIATGVNPSVNLPVGVHTITLTVTDNELATDSDVVVITVQEYTAEQTTIFVPIDDGSVDPGFTGSTIRAQWDNPNRVGYFKFDVTGISGTVTDVKLRLRCNGDAGNGPMRVYAGLHSNWSETNTSNLPLHVGLPGELNQSYNIGAWYTWDLPDHGITGEGTYTFILRHEEGGSDAWFDSRETSSPPELAVTYTPAPSEVVSRHAFNNDTWQDGDTSGASPLDDGAIVTDRPPLLPGEAIGANCTGYTAGLNGIMVDIDHLADSAGLTMANLNDYFAFRWGDGGDPGTWSPAPDPIAVNVRQGQGTAGSDRATIIWDDNLLVGGWLEVTTLPTVRTGLEQADVFYLANLPGDADGDADVDITDLAILASNWGGGVGYLGCSGGDFNLSGNVGLPDLAILASNYGASLDEPITALPPTSSALRDSTPEPMDILRTARPTWDDAPRRVHLQQPAAGGTAMPSPHLLMDKGSLRRRVLSRR